ncbi:ccr4 associated factor [Sorochytrium milnesiophthora]
MLRLSRRAFHTTRAARGNHYARLPERGLLLLEGPESTKFLQGIITNHMPKIERGGDGFYTAFLTPQGRVLYDAFVYPRNVGSGFPHPSYVIEASSDVLSSVQMHLRKYMLRAKLTLADVTRDYQVWSIWGPSVQQLWKKEYDALEGNDESGARWQASVPAGGLVMRHQQNVADIGCTDPRWSGMGLRVLLPQGDKPKLLDTFKQVDAEEYHLRRYMNGIPEGPQDYFSGVSLPLESNLDYMNGVDFRKGCYLGQELTIRTYHTGVTRKRIVPVQLLTSGTNATTLTVDRSLAVSVPPSQSDILLPSGDGGKTKTVGKFCSAKYNVGLTLMRLEHITADNVFQVAGTDDVWLKPFIPKWWPIVNTAAAAPAKS